MIRRLIIFTSRAHHRTRWRGQWSYLTSQFVDSHLEITAHGPWQVLIHQNESMLPG